MGAKQRGEGERGRAERERAIGELLHAGRDVALEALVREGLQGQAEHVKRLPLGA